MTEEKGTQIRDVARPVANLGNTCYMNAVLQALAHAPELCLAMDVAPHRTHCPIWKQNSQKRRTSPSSSPDRGAGALPQASSGVRKSRRQSRSPPEETNDDDVPQFCALCEVEEHLYRVHSSHRDRPVAPTSFVNGFINHVAPWFKLGQQEDSHEFLRLLIDAMQGSCPAENPQDTPRREDQKEYPFQLFRGMVESNVTCGSCGSSSATMDPIEDIGLDVSSSTPGMLTDVATALQRFARAEALDAGYKCEKCGKEGRATKQSRLASIPPILTLHLKRFRYGETQTTPTTNQRRSRSELSQLLNHDLGGKSGSAKIEGHSKFNEVLNLKPYLTEDMQAKHKTMLCRLFAVVVHAGKNSHSGHYIAYVRNITRNEWWKMDDSRVTIATADEVKDAEAYMLFYRVVEHPFSVKLRDQAQELPSKSKEVAAPAAPPKLDTTTTPVTVQKDLFEDSLQPKVEDVGSIANSSVAMSSLRSNNSRKRKAPECTSGEAWAKLHTSLSENQYAKFREVELCLSEYVQFKPDFFRFLTDQASRRNAKVGHGPSSGICEDDIQDGTAQYKRALLEVMHCLYMAKEGIFFDKKQQTKSAAVTTTKVDKSSKSLIADTSSTVSNKKVMVAVTSSMVDPDEDPLL